MTDRSFLDRGLADCTTVRMNFAALQTPTSTSACTLYTTGAQGSDRITRNVYDNAGQLLKIQKAYLITTANGFPATLQQDYVTYAYTSNSKQQFVTDANGNKAQFKYDGFDRPQCWIFPSKTTPGMVSGDCVSAQPTGGDYEKYTYDAAGNRLSLRRRDGRTLTFTYDNLSRMLSKLIPDGCPPIQPPGTGCPAASATRDVFYGYDLLGRQLTAKFDSSGGADGITNSYDGFGNLASSTIAMGGFSKAVTSLYDCDNQRIKVTHPDAQAFSYTYDARDRVTGVYEGAGTPSGACGWTPPATALDGFIWNADDTLASRLEGGSSGSANYSYDPIGRLVGQSDAFPAAPASNLGWNFQINQASQILSETRTNDAYAFTGIPTANKAYTVNGLNQYTAVAGTGHTYDANGNLTGDGTNAYIYDGENRLVSATAAGQTTTLTYDPLGRLWRVQKGAADTRFLYDGDAVIGEYDGSGILSNRYVHGSNSAADDALLWYIGSGTGTKRYLHADHLGSVIAATNAANAPSINAYDEYGVPKAGNVGRFQYTGQIWLSELGLYHYKARLYSPTLGRFLQTDPIGHADQINLYAYVANDPINVNDPTGLCEWGLASGASGSSECPNAIHASFQQIGGRLSTGQITWQAGRSTAKASQPSQGAKGVLLGRPIYQDRKSLIRFWTIKGAGSGFILQHVTSTLTINGKTQPTIEFNEAWTRVGGRWPYGQSDKFWIECPGRCGGASLTVKATAWYYEAPLPSSLKEGAVPQAKDLPSSYGPPPDIGVPPSAGPVEIGPITFPRDTADPDSEN